MIDALMVRMLLLIMQSVCNKHRASLYEVAQHAFRPSQGNMFRVGVTPDAIRKPVKKALV